MKSHKNFLISKPIILLGLFVITAFIVFAYFAVLRYMSLSSYYFDLGIAHQVVHNTSRGLMFEMTDPNMYYQTSRLGLHFDPMMTIFSPIYALWSDARVLIIGQALILALGAVPAYLLALSGGLTFGISLAIALSYLLYFPMQNTAMADFHSVTIGTTLLLWAYYFAETKRFKWSFLTIVLLWFVKENVALITMFLGLYFWFIKKEKKFGQLVAGTSLAAFIIIFGFAIPTLRGGEHFAATYYTTDIATNAQRLFREQTVQYFGNLMTPVGFVALFSPLHLLIALPEWLIVLLSANDNMRMLQYHYTALLTPFMFIATIYGIKILSRYVNPKLVVTSIVTLSLFTSYTSGPFPKADYRIPQKELQVVQYWQEQLADESISVATSGHLAPHFSGRRYFYNFLFDYAYPIQGYTDTEITQLVDHYTQADYVLIKKSEMRTDHEMTIYYYNHLKGNPLFVKIFDEEGIEVYKKL